jgi:poly(3-hydroxybutyrate) depolymerase
MYSEFIKTAGSNYLNKGDAPLPFYHLYELNHAAMAPLRAMADMTKLYFQNPLNPMTHTSMGRQIAASCEVLERTTRRYGKPDFGIDDTVVGGVRVPVRETAVWSRPFCDLIRFERGVTTQRNDPKILIVAPMSGHYATLLRGTVEALLPNADVYITDWIDARMVPIQDGKFDLDDYIDYIISMLHFLGPDAHVLRRLPTVRSGAGRRCRDGRPGRSVCSIHNDLDGRTDRHPRCADRRK